MHLNNLLTRTLENDSCSESQKWKYSRSPSEHKVYPNVIIITHNSDKRNYQYFSGYKCNKTDEITQYHYGVYPSLWKSVIIKDGIIYMTDIFD